MHLVIFENSDAAEFAPFSFFRPVFCLRSGVGTLLDRQVRHYRPDRLSLWVRPEFTQFCRRHVLPQLPLPVRSKTLINEPLDGEPVVFCGAQTLALRSLERPLHPTVAPGLQPTDAFRNSDRFQSATESMHKNAAAAARFAWDLLTWNQDALMVDLAAARMQSHPPGDGPFHVVNRDDVLCGDGVKLQPGCVIDASGGPVLIGESTTIGANAVVVGPCAIGSHCEITPLALIRPRTSIGPNCKIGGEVSASIIQGFSNKSHDGFLGDSYLGEWVNLGAGTTTSNLKNTYGKVSMRLGKTEIDIDRQFLGSLVGDHTKTAIGTRLMTGSYVGGCSMIATSELPPRFIPSFQFLTDAGVVPYRFEKAVEVAKAAYGRRRRIMEPDDLAILQAAAAWSTAAE